MNVTIDRLAVEGYQVKKIDYNPFESGVILKASSTTKAQREIWSLIDSSEEATLCFNNSVKVEFTEFIDAHLLGQAFQQVFQNHDALRMTFSSNGEMFFVKEDFSLPLILHDLSNIQEAEEFLKEICVKEMHLPFNLEAGPCIRCYFIKLKYEQSVLILSVHHLICDRRSLNGLLNEIAKCYERLLQGKNTSYQLTPTFFDFALAENASFKPMQFSDLKTRHFPTDFERPVVRRLKSKRIDLNVPESTVRNIKNLNTTEKCSFSNTLIAALSILIARITHCDEVTIGLINTRKLALNEERLIGHLEYIFPFKIHLVLTENFTMLLREVKRKMADSFCDQECDFKNRSLINIVFNVEQQSSEELFFGKVKAKVTTIPKEYENFEIFINAKLSGDKLTLECQYNPELYKLSSITNWLQVYAELLSSLTEFKTETLEKISYRGLIIPEILNSSVT